MRWPARASSTASPCTCTPRTLRADAPRVDLTSSPTAQPPRRQRAGDDGAEALDREDAVDRQAQQPLGILGRRVARASSRARRAASRAPPRSSPTPARSARPRGRCPRAAARTSSCTSSSQSGVDEVGLGQRHHAAREREQAADVEVLARLRHHALVGGDHQHHEVDAARARDHVADEALVARHVDDADRRARRGRSRCAKPSSMVIPRAFSSGAGRCRCRSAR